MELPHTSLKLMKLFQFFLLHVALFTSIIVNLPSPAKSSSPSRSNETNRLALLAFKDQISSDPNGFLRAWNDSIHFCMWAGVTCSRRHLQRVTALNITEQRLAGYLSPHIANLSFLRFVNFSDNDFQGQIPQELGHLSRLRVLILSSNSFNGQISKNLTHCLELQYLSLHDNNIVGEIPYEIGYLPKLSFLRLSKNNLTSSIPPSLGNLSSLIYLSLVENHLEGTIPDDLGRLLYLEILAVGRNKLLGMLPPSIYNLSSITVLAVELNFLHGDLLPQLGLAFPKLKWLYAGTNRFTGTMPISLVNASTIEELDLGSNKFTGSVPANIGMLQQLKYFNIQNNQLGGGKDDDLSFIISLTNCSDLESLLANDNQFSGTFPNSIGNLSTQLARLVLGGNQIFGTIPRGIENLAGLNALYLSYNLLSGIIPSNLGKLSNIQRVYLTENNLSGQIPTSIGNLTRLYELTLNGNDLRGRIHSNLGNCQHLEVLYLSKNNLDGTIPIEVQSIPALRELHVDANALTGSLSLLVNKLKNLNVLDVSSNRLSGEIPSTLGNCISLEFIYMEGNFFQGSIPPSLGGLRGLQELDLSRNNLTGKITKAFENLPFLQHLNVSFNKLEGEVPINGIFQNTSAISIVENGKLCGGIPELRLPACSKDAFKKQKKVFPLTIVISTIAAIFFLSLFLCFLTKRCWLNKPSKKPTSATSMKEFFLELTYAELLKATNGFSSANLIGAGSYGCVYKGILDCQEKAIAVKVLNFYLHKASKSFLAECKALRSIQHRNIVKILTVCSSIDFGGNDFKALVYEYMPHGNLDMWLHPKENEQPPLRNLNFIQRLNIAIDVACALDYLHNHCQEPIVHCDLKPSNVLLDDDMVTHVGDFGLARILFENTNNLTEIQSSSSTIKGSIGYIALEHGIGSDVSTYGDVYSYGILLLELFTGKRPIDDMFEVNLSLYQYAKMMLPERVMQIVDHRLLEEIQITRYKENYDKMQTQMQTCIVSLVKIGVTCSAESINERMEMSDTVRQLQKVRDIYLGLEIMERSTGGAH